MKLRSEPAAAFDAYLSDRPLREAYFDCEESEGWTTCTDPEFQLRTRASDDFLNEEFNQDFVGLETTLDRDLEMLLADADVEQRLPPETDVCTSSDTSSCCLQATDTAVSGIYQLSSCCCCWSVDL